MSYADAITAHCRALEHERLMGVYFLILNGEIVYVGQSDDLRARVAAHVAAGEKVFDRVLWIPAARGDLSATEGAFIRAFNPPLNNAAPRIASRDAEILARFGLSPNPEASLAFRRRIYQRQRSGQLRRVA